MTGLRLNPVPSRIIHAFHRVHEYIAALDVPCIAGILGKLDLVRLTKLAHRTSWNAREYDDIAVIRKSMLHFHAYVRLMDWQANETNRFKTPISRGTPIYSRPLFVSL